MDQRYDNKIGNINTSRYNIFRKNPSSGTNQKEIEEKRMCFHNDNFTKIGKMFFKTLFFKRQKMFFHFYFVLYITQYLLNFWLIRRMNNIFIKWKKCYFKVNMMFRLVKNQFHFLKSNKTVFQILIYCAEILT